MKKSMLNSYPDRKCQLSLEKMNLNFLWNLITRNRQQKQHIISVRRMFDLEFLIEKNNNMTKDEGKSDLLAKMIPDAESILDENALLELFTKRVEEMMREDLGLLLSSLYRLDVEEDKIQIALKSSTIPAAQGIASLIIERQKEKINTRKKYSSGNAGNWEGLE